MGNDITYKAGEEKPPSSGRISSPELTNSNMLVKGEGLPLHVEFRHNIDKLTQLLKGKSMIGIYPKRHRRFSSLFRENINLLPSPPAQIRAKTSVPFIFCHINPQKHYVLMKMLAKAFFLSEDYRLLTTRTNRYLPPDILRSCIFSLSPFDKYSSLSRVPSPAAVLPRPSFFWVSIQVFRLPQIQEPGTIREI